MKRSRPHAEDYTVGWICALPVELAAVREILDEEHNDANVSTLYMLGRVSEHNVAIACLPAGQIGPASAAAVATQMQSTFPSIRIGLMVGIGGGVPSTDADIRLGDVVISQPHGVHGGVVQYDLGKTGVGGHVTRTGSLNAPPTVLLNALANLQPNYLGCKSNHSAYLSAFNALPAFAYGNTGPDILFESTYDHVEGAMCDKCSKDKVVERTARESQEIVVHYGTIASGNQVIKDGVTRDRLSSELGGILCFEMEAAGLMNTFPCLVIRGICDYADSHKNKKWQPYAAATAAACAKELLLVIPAKEVAGARTVKQAFESQDYLYSVPLETVHSYTERRTLSSTIKEKLHICHQNDSVPHALALYGLGGTGKTQLALKFVEDHKEEYNPILWIDGKSPETVQSSFECCANELQLSVDRASTQKLDLENLPTVQAVLRWLRGRKESDHEWLVVVDNADDLTWGIKRIIPKGRRGNIIITSQDDQSPRLLEGRCEKLRVDLMEPLEASTLLLQHLNWDSHSVPSQVQNISDAIVGRLGYLALAVDLAGAFIGNDPNQEAALNQYLTDYGKHQDALLRSEYFRGLPSYDKTVWTVWDTTLKTIERRYPDVQAGLLLAFLAHFNRGLIQDELFRLASLGFSVVYRDLCQENQDLPHWLKRFIGIDQREWDSFHYREALKPLIRYSLLQRVDGEWPGVTMHSLVQWRAMNHDEDQPWGFWYLIFISAVSHQNFQEHGRPQFRRHMILHIPVLDKSYLEAMRINDRRKALIWAIIGNIYYKEGRWKETQELETQVMETRRRLLGLDHVDTMGSMANLASTYRKQGRWEEAEKLQMAELETCSRVLGRENPSTLTSMANLASTYQNQGRWKEAEELEVQVMETSKRVLGEEHPDTLTSMANLASTFWKLGRWKEAEELEVWVIETSKRVLGEEHPDTLTSMANLALTFGSQGRWKEAEELNVQVMETRKRVLREEHPDTLTSIANLASTFWNQGRWKEAEELEVQVMETRKRVLGEEHPDTLTSINNLALMFKAQGRNNEAVLLIEKCF